MNQFDSILIYEDDLARSRRFLPLAYTRPIAALRSGAFSGLDRVKALFPGKTIHLHTSPQLAAVSRERYELRVNEVPAGATLLLNARALVAGDLRGEVVGAVPADMAKVVSNGSPVSGSESNDVTALWDIIHQNPKIILSDVEIIRSDMKVQPPKSIENMHAVNPKELMVHPTASIGLGVIFDCSDGPVIVQEGAKIMHNAVIVGPAVIGKNSLVKIGAKIYGGTSIGPVSKMGGEIENSIVQGYSNKQHDGYLGHSYLGEWVNLGADTNTSDLKNDYSNVRVTIEGEEFDTGSMFVGLMMGDHSKSAINTQFNTGTAVGVSSNIFDAGFLPKWVPSFSWGGRKDCERYTFEKAIAVAKAVMARRNVPLSLEEATLLESLSKSAG